MKNLLILLSLFLLFTSETCEQSSDNGDFGQPAESFISVQTSGCYGTCPIYEFTIMGNGESTYNGKRFVATEGEQSKTFSADKTNALFTAFKDANYWSFKDEYTSNITDLPTTYLTYSHNGNSKKIKLYADVPERLVGLSKLIKSFANSEGWVKSESAN